jgi:hypothetical protein
MKRAWLLLPLAALATLAIVPLTTVFGDDGPPEPSIFAVDLGAGFTYQGLFKDGGDPANGTYDIRFILYDADSGGTQIGSTVTKEDITVTDGLFTTTLDFGASSFTGDARWLEIAVRDGASTDTFTVLNPRQPITAVPDALHAVTAGGFTPPLDVSGSLDGDPLVTVTQDGDGDGMDVTRNASDVNGNALGVTNSGAGAAVSAVSGADAGIGVDAIANGVGGIGGAFEGDTAVLLDGAVQVGAVSPAAFKIYADTSSNTCDAGAPDDALIIDSPLANGDPFALIFITLDGNAGFPEDVQYFVDYDAPGTCPSDQWVIRRLDASDWADTDTVNVLIINQTVIQ